MPLLADLLFFPNRLALVSKSYLALFMMARDLNALLKWAVDMFWEVTGGGSDSSDSGAETYLSG